MRAAMAVAAGTAGAVGVYDDLAGDQDTRGLAGHLGALRRGEVTTGAVKILGLGFAGITAGALVHRDPRDAVSAAITVAAAANAVNLLDLRPGRALKSGLVLGLAGIGGPAAVPAAGAFGAAAALLPDDLAERVMLGDGGAGAFGAAVGVAIAAGASRRGLRRIALALSAVNVASELVSFSSVISAVPPLRAFDEWGRR
jgi:UDP-N-acetylmuramyl pentapeptide phosphotransferase/UDP-N-acetylglucosamine-1-phosphate transferase